MKKMLDVRLEVFSDSKDLANALKYDEGNIRYWADEAAAHIEGLWKLANELSEQLNQSMVNKDKK
jgi:hypothetical protein